MWQSHEQEGKALSYGETRCNVIIMLTNSLPFECLAHIQHSDINPVLWAHALSPQIVPKCQAVSWKQRASQELISKVLHIWPYPCTLSNMCSTVWGQQHCSSTCLETH